MLCSACQSTIAEGAKFCPKCGARAVAPAAETAGKRCPQCGTENLPTAKYCKKDGFPLAAAEVQPEAATATASPVQETEPPAPPSANGSIICAQCGAANAPGAKFCKKDGYPLQPGGSASPAPRTADQHTPANKPAKGSKGVVIAALLGAIILCAAGGYAYWSGFLGNRPDRVQDKITAELTNRGMNNIKVTVDRDWVATLSGTLLNQAEKDQALAVAKTHTELKKIVDAIQIQADPTAVQNMLRKALAEAGLGAFEAQVDKDLVATLSGVAENPEQKTQALDVANGVSGLKSVKDEIQVAAIPEPTPQAPPIATAPTAPTPSLPATSPPRSPIKLGPPQPPTARSQATAIDPAKLEGDINRALRSSGASGVTAQVSDDLNVTLKGSGSASEKNRALQVLRQFREIRAVKDKIFVVE